MKTYENPFVEIPRKIDFDGIRMLFREMLTYISAFPGLLQTTGQYGNLCLWATACTVERGVVFSSPAPELVWEVPSGETSSGYTCGRAGLSPCGYPAHKMGTERPMRINVRGIYVNLALVGYWVVFVPIILGSAGTVSGFVSTNAMSTQWQHCHQLTSRGWRDCAVRD